MPPTRLLFINGCATILMAFWLALPSALAQRRGAAATAPRALLQKWYHSFEENAGPTASSGMGEKLANHAADYAVFRPDTFAFPLARGRRGFAFLPKGRFEQYDIAPTDGNETTRGTWRWRDKATVQIALRGVRPGRPATYRLRVVSLAPGRLVVQTLSSTP